MGLSARQAGNRFLGSLKALQYGIWQAGTTNKTNRFLAIDSRGPETFKKFGLSLMVTFAHAVTAYRLLARAPQHSLTSSASAGPAKLTAANGVSSP